MAASFTNLVAQMVALFILNDGPKSVSINVPDGSVATAGHVTDADVSTAESEAFVAVTTQVRDADASSAVLSYAADVAPEMSTPPRFHWNVYVGAG